MIVLDTNIVSEPLKAAPDQNVVRWLDSQAPETLFVTTIALAELRLGVALLPRGKKKQLVSQQVEDGVADLFAGRVLAFDERASVAYAELRATARRSGKALGDFDALMAGIALAHGFGVATRDTSPFEAAGLKVINPFDHT